MDKLASLENLDLLDLLVRKERGVMMVLQGLEDRLGTREFLEHLVTLDHLEKMALMAKWEPLVTLVRLDQPDFLVIEVQ